MHMTSELSRQIYRTARALFGKKRSFSIVCAQDLTGLLHAVERDAMVPFEVVDALSISRDAQGSLHIKVADVARECVEIHERGHKAMLDVSSVSPALVRQLPHDCDGVMCDITLDAYHTQQPPRLAVCAYDTSVGMASHLPDVVDTCGADRLTDALITLPFTMRRRCDMASALAAYLEAHPRVMRVSYPGLKCDDQHERARNQLVNGFGPYIVMELPAEGAAPFFSSLAMIKKGQRATLSVFTSIEMISSADASEGGGVVAYCIHVGLEDIDDIVADIEQALRSW